MWKRLRAILTCLLVGFWAADVRAEVGVIILDTGAPPSPGGAWPEAEQRARAELAAVGLTTLEVDVGSFDANDPMGAMRAAARAHHAVAVLRVVRLETPPGAELWLLDEVTGKISVRHVSTENVAPSEAVALVALSAVELLNASLLELRAPHRPRGATPPTDTMLRMVEGSLDVPAAPFDFALRGGMAAVVAPGGLGLLGGPAVGAGWGLSPTFSLEADVLATATATSLEGQPGTARLGLGMGRLLLVMRGSPAPRLQPLIGMGAGALLVWARGEPREPYVAHTDATVVALPSIVSGVAARLSRSLRLRLTLGAGVAVPKVAVELAGQPTATGGRPLFDGSLSLEWDWTRGGGP